MQDAGIRRTGGAMNKDLHRRFVRDMRLARAFEERAAQEYTDGRIRGFLHLYPGEEAVAVGVLHAAELSDYIVSTYREHCMPWCAASRRAPSWPNSLASSAASVTAWGLHAHL